MGRLGERAERHEDVAVAYAQVAGREAVAEVVGQWKRARDAHRLARVTYREARKLYQEARAAVERLGPA